MTKLLYPRDGMYRSCTSDLNNIKNNLTSAIAGCVFDIPSSFSYGGYLRGLSSTLESYKRETRTIDSKIYQIDQNYENLETELVDEINKILPIKVKERDRLIV